MGSVASPPPKHPSLHASVVAKTAPTNQDQDISKIREYRDQTKAVYIKEKPSGNRTNDQLCFIKLKK